ncbi:MAG: DMT family transporter [Chloroflexota bacterium]
MQALLLVILIGLVSGASIGLQGPMANMISQRLGVMESVIIVHIGGALAGILALLAFGKGTGKLSQWRELPWYLLAAGIFGLVVLSAYTYMIPRIGVTTAVLVTVTGQLAVSAVLDQYGFLGAEIRPLTLPRLLGIVVMFLGVWLTVKD